MEKFIKLYKKYEEIINYIIVGGLTTVVSLGSYYLAVIFVLNPNNGFELQIANIFSWICAVTFAYIANRNFVFKVKSQNRIKEISSFVSCRIFTLFMDMTFMFLLVTLLRWNDKIAKLIVQIVVTIANYLFSKLIVFKNE